MHEYKNTEKALMTSLMNWCVILAAGMKLMVLNLSYVRHALMTIERLHITYDDIIHENKHTLNIII